MPGAHFPVAKPPAELHCRPAAAVVDAAVAVANGVHVAQQHRSQHAPLPG